MVDERVVVEKEKCWTKIHFHIAGDMGVRQVRVRFLALKSAKGVFLASKACKGCHFQAIKVSNFRKIIISFDQIKRLYEIFSIMQRYTAGNLFSGILGCIFSNFALQRVRVWKSLAHIHILDYIGVPQPVFAWIIIFIGYWHIHIRNLFIN